MLGDSKIAFFGCKNVTKTCLKKFQREIAPIDYLITISPKLGEANSVAGYMDLREFCSNHDIKVYTAEKYSLNGRKDIQNIGNFNIDVAFAIGWQRLIPKEVLNQIKVGVFGMHGSADNLPKGRGRSPMNWALILGRKEFFTNLFKYQDNVDGGGVLDSYHFEIKKDDTIETLHFKNMLSMHSLIKRNIGNIIDNSFDLDFQNDEQATYFPKRNPEDGYLDWDMKTNHIINLSRALTEPFPGCMTILEGSKVKIWDMNEFSNLFNYSKAEPGKILEVFYNNKFVVKTRDSSVIIHSYDAENISEIKPGKVFESVSYKKIYSDIEKRYYPFVSEDQKEITLNKIESYYG